MGHKIQQFHRKQLSYSVHVYSEKVTHLLKQNIGHCSCQTTTRKRRKTHIFNKNMFIFPVENEMEMEKLMGGLSAKPDEILEYGVKKCIKST